MENKLSIAWC